MIMHRIFAQRVAFPARFHKQPDQSRPLSQEAWPMGVLKIHQATAQEPQGATRFAKALWYDSALW